MCVCVCAQAEGAHGCTHAKATLDQRPLSQWLVVGTRGGCGDIHCIHLHNGSDRPGALWCLIWMRIIAWLSLSNRDMTINGTAHASGKSPSKT